MCRLKITITHNEKYSKRFILTVIDSIDLVNETLVGELRCQRGEQVNITVQEEQSIKHGQDLILTASELPLHSQHHVGNMLTTSREFLSQSNSFTSLLLSLCPRANLAVLSYKTPPPYSPVHSLLSHISVEWCHTVPVTS